MFKGFQIGVLNLIFYVSLLCGLVAIWFFPIGTIIGIILFLMAYGCKLEIKDVENRYMNKEKNKQASSDFQTNQKNENKRIFRDRIEAKVKKTQENEKKIQDVKLTQEKKLEDDKEKLKIRFQKYINFLQVKENEIKDLYPYLRPKSYIITNPSGHAEYNFRIGMPPRLSMYMADYGNTKRNPFYVKMTFYNNSVDNIKGCIVFVSHTDKTLFTNSISLKKLELLLTNALALLISNIRKSCDEGVLIKEYKDSDIGSLF